MAYRYCPSCGAEYREGFARCSDCDVELVDEAPAGPTQPDIDYFPSLDPRSAGYIYAARDWVRHLEPVKLMTVGSELEAEMLVGMLHSNEVRAYSQNESSHGISHYGGQAARSSALALYRIYVHPDDEADARSLVEEVDLSTDEPDETEEQDPRTGTAFKDWGSTSRVAMAIALLIAAFVLLSAFWSALQDAGF